MRKIKFDIGSYYHIYNRGVDKRRVFIDKGDYFRCLFYLRKSSFSRGSASATEAEPLISLAAYNLLPNHYHLLVKQNQENGISIFMHNLATAYTMFFNAKHNRSGVLFQGKFKAEAIKSDAQLLYISAYINGNAEIHRITKAENWPWSSFRDYTGRTDKSLCSCSDILKEFKDINGYKKYLAGVIKDSGKRKEILRGSASAEEAEPLIKRKEYRGF